jgi:hypothetical protein
MSKSTTLDTEIYKILYKSSRVDGVRVLYEDEWPINELKALIQREVEKARKK